MMTILSYGFMQRAFAAGLIIAVIAPMIGTFLTVRRYALIADTLSHVALAGVALGLLFHFQPVLAAAVTTVVMALLVDELRTSRRYTSDSLLALILSGSLAFAVVAMSAVHSLSASTLTYLFGSISTVSPTDLAVIAALGAFVFVMTILLYKELFLVSFDEEVATAQGAPTRLMNAFLVVMTALTVSVAMRVVGILLIGALMVIPVLSAMNVARRFSQTITIAVILAVASVLIGIIASYELDVASGGMIVLIAIFFFFLSFLSRKKFA